MNNFASDCLNRPYLTDIKLTADLSDTPPADLTDGDLLDRTRALIFDEKRLLHLILDHIREIEDRKLYAARGYSSLFAFVVEGLGYDEASAYRRIAAVRAIRDVPTVKQKLQNGSLTLSTVALVHGHLRTESKARSKSPEQKSALFAEVEGKSKRETERHLASLTPDSHAGRPERQRPVTATRTELRLTVNAEFMQRLERLRELHFHTDPFAKMEDLLGYALAVAIRKKDPGISRTKKSVTPEKAETVEKNGKAVEIENTKKAEKTAMNGKAETNENTETSPDEPVTGLDISPTQTVPTRPSEPPFVLGRSKPPLCAGKSTAPSRYIPAEVKRTVYHRDAGRCQYWDPLSKRRCLSRTGIEFDHVVPFALGGASTVENLRCLCRTHNQWVARQPFAQESSQRVVTQ